MINYQQDRMGVAEGIALVFVVTFKSVFLSEPVRSIVNGAGLAWLIVFLHGMVLLGLLLLMLQVFKHYPGCDLLEVAERILGKWGAWLVGIYYVCLFVFNSALNLRQFAENTLLTALPQIEFKVIAFWYGVAAAVLVYFGVESLARALYTILPFIVSAVIIVLLLLRPFYQIYFLAPWLGTGIGQVISFSLKVVGIDLPAVLLLVLATRFPNLAVVKNAAIFGLTISTVLKSLSTLVFCMVFGTAVGQEKVLPFYEMARLVYLSRYLQRVEALFIILWVIVGLGCIAVTSYLGTYLLARLLRLPDLKPLIPIMAMISIELASWPPDIISVIELDEKLIETYATWGAYGVPAIFIAAYWFKQRQRKGGKAWVGG